MNSSFSFARWPVALLLLMAIHAWILFSWAKKDTRTLAWDQAIHTKVVFEYQDRLAKGSFMDIFKPAYFNYPPLYHLSLVPFLSRVSDIADVAISVNFLYLCLLIITVFLIGQKLMDSWAGFSASVIVSCYPLLIDLSRDTMIDLSLTAWVAVAFYCLLTSENFSKLGWSVAFGVSLGAGMLTKWTALAYVLVPFLFSTWNAFRKGDVRNWILAVIVAGVLMFPWYIQNLVPMFARISKLTRLPPASGENLTGLANFFWYPLSFRQQLGIFFLVLFVPGIFVALWRPKFWPVFLWFLGSLILFSSITNRNTRYFAPALPAVALLSVAWLPTLRQIPNLFVTGVALVLLFTYPGKPAVIQDWKHQDITQKVLNIRSTNQTPVKVLVVSNHPYFHGMTLNVSARSQKIKDVSFGGPSKRRWFEFADFVLVKTGDIGPDYTLGTINECLQVIDNPKSWFPHVFKEVGRWPLPEKSEAILYQYKPDPVAPFDFGLFNLSLKHLDLPNIHATDVGLKVEPLKASDSQIGHFKELDVRCGTLEYKGLPFRDVHVCLKNPYVNLPLYFETQEIQLNRVETIEVHGAIPMKALLEYASEKAKWLKDPKIEFQGSILQVNGTAFGIPLEVKADVQVEHDVLSTKLLSLRVSKIPLPLILFRAVTDQVVPLSKNNDQTYNLEIQGLSGSNDVIRIGL